MVSFWESVQRRLKEDERVFIALVVDHSVHSPGTAGARMAVFTDGSTLGTIGGGIMELDIVRSAGDSLITEEIQPPRIQKLYHRNEGEGEKSGLVCAGFQTNLYATFDREKHLEALNAMVDAQLKDVPAVFEFNPDGFAVENVSDLSDQRQLTVAGDSWRYRESVRNLTRIAILGGGHCGLALSRLMHRLGYHVSVFDTRPRVPTMLENDFTDEKHIVDDFAEAAALIRLREHTHVVVMTTALASDIRALLGVARFSFPFVGVMGSRAKIVAIRKALDVAGVSRRFFENLQAPVGLSIGSNTPEEIAVSVAAQLLQLRSDSGPRTPERALGST